MKVCRLWKEVVIHMFDLTGKVALVTGTSTGLGESIAIGLAQAGAKIMGVSRRDSFRAREEIEKAGGTFTQIRADISDISGHEKIVQETVQKYGQIDILVNNAGTTFRAQAEDFSSEDWDHVIAVNQRAPYFLSQAVAKEWIRGKRGGKIINLCSIRTFEGGNGVSAYTASKTALAGITRSLATEWAKYNIQVNAIAPGFFETEISEVLRADPKRNEEIIRAIPAGRWGKPEEIRGTVIYLASGASDYVNGHVLVLDGGYMA
jgi:2-deoxy-D-gluconate 3-dehydrogenase